MIFAACPGVWPAKRGMYRAEPAKGYGPWEEQGNDCNMPRGVGLARRGKLKVSTSPASSPAKTRIEGLNMLAGRKILRISTFLAIMPAGGGL